uniref:Uncharacterized protein n=1 Tax=Anguilla anguilla TaxID=7936 RepID=A0A0E9TII8_ANGAN
MPTVCVRLCASQNSQKLQNWMIENKTTNLDQTKTKIREKELKMVSKTEDKNKRKGNKNYQREESIFCCLFFLWLLFPKK